MHKLVNGVRVELTLEEQQALLSKWAQAEIEAEEKRNLEEIEKCKPTDFEKLEACYEFCKSMQKDAPLPKMKACLDKEVQADNLQKNLLMP